MSKSRSSPRTAAKSATINPVSVAQALVVAKYLSFRGAASALGIRQSAVSRRVRALEDELGVSLFERHHAGVRVTNAGARYLQQAREALAQLDQASKIAGAAGRGATGQLRIGILSSMGAGFLRELIQAYFEKHPDVAIQFIEAASMDQISLVRKRRLDVAFVVDASAAIGCDVVPLWNERLFVALPHGHQLCKRNVVEWHALRYAHFIIRQSKCVPALCERVIKHLSDRTHTPAIQKADVGRETIMHLVAMGRGVSLTSEASIATPFPGVVFRPVSGRDEMLQFSAVWWPGNDNPALRRFLSLARALAKGKRQRPNLACPRNSPRSIATGRKSACRSLFSARPRKGAICRHEAGQHRCDQLRRFDGLAGCSAECIRIGNEITMDCGREFHRELDRLVVRHGGQLELRHRVQSQPWYGASTRSRLTITRTGKPGRTVTVG
jgi:DNA-binding transcriptional LysR family regulator